ncbi:MAG: NupC/NupG family nucleoside CNT transporter [Ahniella sp.]|nr:NupC/NupG family nucleoside CNT transporter [Ahniella sp.]
MIPTYESILGTIGLVGIWRPLILSLIVSSIVLYVLSGRLADAATSTKLQTGGHALLGLAALLGLPLFAEAFDTLGHGFVKLSSFTAQGATFILGDVARADKLGFIFAFQVLPTVIFFAAFMAILYHLGIMQAIVRAMAIAITKVMRVSGAETTSVCASIFIGQTEAPLTVRPYISKMTDSELLTMMIGGMAHIAGGVMIAYITMLGGPDPEQQAIFAKHFLAASIMAAPATLLIAKILVPETGEPLTRGTVKVEVEKTAANVIDAAAAGASDGMKLAINIAAMLLAFIALIALLNAVIGWFGDVSGINGMLSAGKETPVVLSLNYILGQILAPIAWIIGVPWSEAQTAGALIGQKVVLNEFIAYSELAAIPVGEGAGAISAHTKLIMTYALCGFANFASIAIQIGGIGGLAPDRRTDLARFGMRAVLGGSIATFMTATIAGVLSQFAG